LTAYLFNTVALQVGYDFPEDLSVLATAESMSFEPVKGVFDRTRKTNQPWIDTIGPDILITAPGTKNARNCRWWGKFMIMPTRVLKEMPGVQKNKVSTNKVPDEITRHEGNKWMEEAVAEEGYTAFWEVHEMESNTWFWMDTNGKFFMGPTDDPTQIDGCAVEFLSFNRSRDIWGTPDSIYIMSQMLEGDECRQDGRLQRRMALVRAFVDSDLIGEEEAGKILSGDPMALIRIKNLGTKKLSDSVMMVQPHVQLEYLEYQKFLLNDSQLIAGIGPNQAGTFAQGRRTKFETQVVEENNLLRTGLRRENLSNAIGNIFGRVNQLIVKNWTAPVVAKVIGNEGAMHWVNAKPSEFKELPAQLVTSVNTDSMAPVSRERRKSEMLEVMGVLAKMKAGDMILPILQTFLSTFEWSTMANSLPVANGGQAVGINDFQQQQQQAVQSGTAGPQAVANLQGLNNLVRKLPSTGKGASNGK